MTKPPPPPQSLHPPTPFLVYWSDYAMAQEAKGDEAWVDGGIKKILAHSAMGATAANIGNGDALGGAL